MKSFVRDFPHNTIHEGAMLGNGWLGLYVWGDGQVLRISAGCSNLWDHRGGLPWTEKQNYTDIRKALETHDMNAIQDIFYSIRQPVKGQPARPSLVPIGRIEILLSDDAELLRTEADYETGCIRAVYQVGASERFAEIRLDMTDKGAFACRCTDIVRYTVLDSYSLISGIARPFGSAPHETAGTPSPLEAISVSAPRSLGDGTLRGFLQPMPADAPYALCASQSDSVISMRFHRDAAPDALRDYMKHHCLHDWDRLKAGNEAWWNAFWARVPKVELANKALENLYYENTAKFGMMTAPDGVPAGLQGPWIEDDALPPWSGDYHFNINIEMCYWPSYRANLLPNLMPLFRMIDSWKPSMRRTAQLFLGIDDGYMLPHAVDDRGICMGGFWSGCVDNACGAWMSQMMYDYYDYSGDTSFLRDIAFDFMKGVFNVFHAMLEWHDGKLFLPVSVSPEYRGDQLDAWGANASFQLAALHRLTLDLISTADILGEAPDERWEQVRTFLPQASLSPIEPDSSEIALWDGQVLEESHRHHSHLGGICPFDTIDPDAPEWRTIVDNSINRWITLGTGQWTGWCTTWAAMIYSRLGNGSMAELTLEYWRRAYCNPGGGSLHDSYFKGPSFWSFRPQIMQMDATMGALTAIQDMLLHSRQGTLHVFAGIPATWNTVSFEQMPAPGGFLVSAARCGRRHFKAVVTATRTRQLNLVIHDDHPLQATLDGIDVPVINGAIHCMLEATHTVLITRK